MKKIFVICSLLVLLTITISVTLIYRNMYNSTSKKKVVSTNSIIITSSSTVATITPTSLTKTAFITIDDGPSLDNTPKILDVLKEYNAKATFFTIYNPSAVEMYKRIIEAGDEIGNHTYSHNYLKLYSNDITYFKNDVLKLHNYLLNKFNYKASVFRFPGGTGGRRLSIINPRINFLKSIGYRYYDWNLSTCDTDVNLTIKNYGSEENIINKLTTNILNKTNRKDNLIILMHDSKEKIYTPKALHRILEGLKSQGYSFKIL